MLSEIFAHGGDNLAPLDEDILDFGINNQVYIPHSISEFRIRESIESFTLLLLDDRQYTERFTQDCKFLCMNGELSCLRNEGITLDTDDITDIKKLLEDGIVHTFVFTGAYFIAFYINLDSSF